MPENLFFFTLGFERFENQEVINMKNNTFNEQEVLDYIQEKLNENIHPSYGELDKKFRISKFRVKLTDLYPKKGVGYLYLNTKRPNGTFHQLRQPLIDFVKENVQCGVYPTRRYIENRFGIRLTGLFYGIKDLYKQAGIEYVLKCSQELKSRKAALLQNLVLNLLPSLNLTLVKERRTHERGVDLIAKDQNGIVVGVEIKAHHQYEPIKERNISQLRRFLVQENLSKIILITTSSQIKAKIDDSRIIVFDFNALRKICDSEQLKLLEQIRTEVVHQETHQKEKIKTQILKYAAEKIKQDGRITHSDLTNIFHIHVFSYFKSILEIYDQLGVLPPLDQMESSRRSHRLNLTYRTKILERMVDYLKEKVSTRHYPTGIELGRKFGSPHIWNFVTMTELYQLAGLKPYLERRRTGEYNKKIHKLEEM